MSARAGVLRDDCFAHPEPERRLRVEEALDALAARATPLTEIVDRTLEEAHGRVLGADVRAPRDVPAFTNVAVDGYALRHADLAPDAPTVLTLLPGRAAAGVAYPSPVAPGQAVRVLTGAPLPSGSDCVVMQEDVRIEDKRLTVPSGLKPGANRRLAGEDMAAGTVALAAGTRLSAAHLAVAAAMGHARLPLRAPLDIGLLSTGDELVELGEELPHGRVYDANRPMLRALLGTLPVTTEDGGIVPDDFTGLCERLHEQAARHHVLLTSGGASKGDEDHLTAALKRLGRVHFWQIAMKPGRPLAFGQIGDCAVIALPGNPVASFVCFLLFVRPLLLALAGAPFATPQPYPLPAAFTMRKKPGRSEWLRARAITDADGVRRVARIEREGSGITTALSAANGLVELPPDVTAVEAGQAVRFYPYSAFGLPET